MKSKSFKGGVHPSGKKETTESLSLVCAFPLTKTVWIPVTQGGAPNTPLVKPGDSVALGQKIAASDAYMSVPVHASVSGTVKKIETRVVTGNVEVPCVVIEADESGTTDFMQPLDPFTCTREDALNRVREAGIVGMGGASFPAHVKLNPPKGSVIEYFLANGAECEPYLTIDARIMEERASAVMDGIAIAMHITGARKGVVVIEDNKRNLVPVLERAIADQRSNPVGAGAYEISVQVCKTRYPQGSEKMLTKAVLGREIPSGGLPAAIGCVIQNVGTLVAISEAFRLGKPLVERPLTISGGACTRSGNYIVPVGTLVGDLIPDTVTLADGVAKIVSGGPLMGFAMKTAAFPVQKCTSGVLFLTKKETVLDEESACIGCGRCVAACQCRLSPVLMDRALQADNLDESIRCGLMDCIECGSCSWVCPSRIQLVQRFRVGKQRVCEEAKKAEERKKLKIVCKGDN